MSQTAPLLPLSVCIVTNKFDDIILQSVYAAQMFAREILIGYDGAVANIPATFKSLSQVTVIPITWNGYSTTKNQLANQAHYDWILSLDSDEIVDDMFISHLHEFPFSKEHTVGKIKRKAYLGHKAIHFGAWGRDAVIRLYNRNFSHWNTAPVHEELEPINGQTEVVWLPGSLLHYTAQTLQEVVRKNNQYAQLAAQKYYKQGKTSNMVNIYLSPIFNFLLGYIVYAGFLDGKSGFNIALATARYTYLKYYLLHQMRAQSVPKSI